MTEAKKYKNLDWTMARTVLLAIVIGLIAAVAAKALLVAIQFFSTYLHPIPLDQLSATNGSTLSMLDVVSLSGLGLVVGLLTYYLMPNHANRGLSHVIEDIHFNRGQTGVKEGFAVGLISAVSIGAGASVGRYGPAVHMGAAAGSGIGSLFKLEEQEKLTLACAGIAAAIAASFSAPIAAVIFVQEVVLRQWRLYQFIPTAAAAVAGSELAQYFGVNFNISSGDVPDIVNSYEFIFFGLVGVACGALAIAFNHALPKGVALGAKIKIDSRLKTRYRRSGTRSTGLLLPRNPRSWWLYDDSGDCRSNCIAAVPDLLGPEIPGDHSQLFIRLQWWCVRSFTVHGCDAGFSDRNRGRTHRDTDIEHLTLCYRRHGRDGRRCYRCRDGFDYRADRDDRKTITFTALTLFCHLCLRRNLSLLTELITRQAIKWSRQKPI